MKVFRAEDYAGTIGIERNGVVVEHRIRVLDVGAWDEYRRLADEARRLTADPDDEAGMQDATTRAIELAIRQLQLLCPTITIDDLAGININRLREMIAYAVNRAMGADDAVSVETKKKRPGAHSAS
jgi:hypothetical protein